MKKCTETTLCFVVFAVSALLVIIFYDHLEAIFNSWFDWVEAKIGHSIKGQEIEGKKGEAGSETSDEKPVSRQGGVRATDAFLFYFSLLSFMIITIKGYI